MDPLKSSGRIIFLCDQIKFLTEKDDNEKKQLMLENESLKNQIKLLQHAIEKVNTKINGCNF